MFYPSPSVKTRGLVGDGGEQKAAFSWILGFQYVLVGIGFRECWLWDGAGHPSTTSLPSVGEFGGSHAYFESLEGTL